MPTETVYGLAADARSAGAVSRIFEAKGRPAGNPLIVHVDSIEMAQRCVAAWPSAAGKLTKAFWPGPLSLVLPKAGLIPDIVTAAGATVALLGAATASMLPAAVMLGAITLGAAAVGQLAQHPASEIPAG